MKKVLLASTILAATAGVAAADMSLSGGANMGVKYNDGVPAGGDELTVHWEVDFAIAGSGETDNGLSFGASLDVDSGPGPANAGDGEVFISGNFGTLTVGNVDVATDGFGIADIGFDGIGVDDDAENLKDGTPGDSVQDVNYAYSFGDFGVIIAGDSTDSDNFSAALTYSGAAFNAGLGYAATSATVSGTGASESTISAEAGTSFGDFSANIFYAMWSGLGDTTGYGVDVSYSGFGAVTVTAAFADTDLAGDDEDFGIGASYDLGGGAKLAGGVGQVDGDTRADFGVTLSF